MDSKLKNKNTHKQHNSMPASLSPSMQLNLSQRDEHELQQLRYAGNDGGATTSNENPVSMVEVVTILHTVPEVSGGAEMSAMPPFNRPMLSSFIAGGSVGGGAGSSGNNSGIALDDVGGSFASAMHDEQIQQRRWSQHRPSTSLVIKCEGNDCASVTICF